MRFDQRHVFQARDRDLLPEIAFLVDFGLARRVLAEASAVARRDRVCAARTLIAGEDVSAAFFYRSLADHLGVRFETDWPEIAPMADPSALRRDDRIRLADPDGPDWLIAPEGDLLRDMVLAHGRGIGSRDIAVTTPAHLMALIAYRAQSAIEHVATHALPRIAPRLSAKGATDRGAGALACIGLAAVLAALVFQPRILGDIAGLFFFAAMSARLVVSAAGTVPPEPEPRPLPDVDLPLYTVLVPLRQEAEILPDLLRALAALDYPRAKLEILLLVEPEDLDTRRALGAARLPAWLHVVFGPVGGVLRTKPRALNIGLSMARGTLLTVYDAEDRPDADQLRKAAAAFAVAPANVVCLQARLAVDNGRDSLIARLFAVEYAALFDILNVGIARLGLPMALGGTSNHFRVATLRTIQAWDAWNVTEDADLGLRLSRFGYGVGVLDSTTWEAGPGVPTVWLRQRRRWMKGWMQTFLVLGRDAPALIRQLGWRKVIAFAVLFVNLVAGPLLFPFFTALVLRHVLAYGVPAPRGLLETVEPTLAASVILLGIATPLWCGYMGLRQRALRDFLPCLPLFLIYQFTISAAAWWGFFDLLRRPHHWHKTPHGMARPDEGRKAAITRSWHAGPPPRRMALRRSPRRSWRRARKTV